MKFWTAVWVGSTVTTLATGARRSKRAAYGRAAPFVLFVLSGALLTAILGFADVLSLMVTVIWLARRRDHRLATDTRRTPQDLVLSHRG